MELSTSLTKEQVKQRLFTRTKPYIPPVYSVTLQIFSKWNKDDSFYIVSAPRTFLMRPLPFVGRVREDENGTVIVGNFTWTKAERIFFFCSCCLLWTVVLFAFFSDPITNPAEIAFPFVFVSLVTTLGFIFSHSVPRLFQKKHQAEVIDFIEKNLLH